MNTLCYTPSMGNEASVNAREAYLQAQIDATRRIREEPQFQIKNQHLISSGTEEALVFVSSVLGGTVETNSIIYHDRLRLSPAFTYSRDITETLPTEETDTDLLPDELSDDEYLDDSDKQANGVLITSSGESLLVLEYYSTKPDSSINTYSVDGLEIKSLTTKRSKNQLINFMCEKGILTEAESEELRPVLN